ncbi:MAG: cobalamin B12-binding domain-containing protein [Oligoflexia bacterium]|nr:cobalamin B12-binding domain-containing protein [Oligoflexia bacterium]
MFSVNESTQQSNCELLLIAFYQEAAAFGVRQLYNYLTSNGHSVSMLFFKERTQENPFPTPTEICLLLDFIKKEKSQIIGLSVLSIFFPIAKVVSEEISKVFPGLIIWGGVHPTLCPEECINYADAVVIGDGEMPLDLIIKN